MRQKSICEFCGMIRHKTDASIICGPKFLPPSLGINMNKFNDLHGEEPNELPREWNSQPPVAHLKSRTSPPNISTVVSAITGRLNNHAINNGYVEFHPSEFIVEFKYEYVPDPDNTPIKSIDDDETDHLPEFFHSEHDEDLLDVGIQMLQA